MGMKYLTVRMTEEELALIDMQAKACNEKRSTYVRNTVLNNQKRYDTQLIKTVKPIIRNIQTSYNMIHQNIDIENQKDKLTQEVQKLCQVF